MGLTTCPDCQSEVSDVAPTCPKCGRPLQEAEGPKCYACDRPATTKCQRCGKLSCVEHVQPIDYQLARPFFCDACVRTVKVRHVLFILLVVVLFPVGLFLLYYYGPSGARREAPKVPQPDGMHDGDNGRDRPPRRPGPPMKWRREGDGWVGES
jgi:hypothetical protein